MHAYLPASEHTQSCASLNWGMQSVEQRMHHADGDRDGVLDGRELRDLVCPITAWRVP